MKKRFTISLRGLLGDRYVDAVLGAAAALTEASVETLARIADRDVDISLSEFYAGLDRTLGLVGKPAHGRLSGSSAGAGTDSFNAASHLDAAPIGGRGFVRAGEDGRCYLSAKSEHYHASLGLNFPGYALVRTAAELGIQNPTHNNTRGHITRVLEREIVRAANGIAADDDSSLEAVISSEEPGILNRVINLETGSLAAEAGFKMMLSRFYRLNGSRPVPVHHGKTPVFLVISDNDGGPTANYHGTTILTQCLRGMWPELRGKLEEAGIMKVCPVAINDIGDFGKKLAAHETNGFKVAGFIHEIVLMNYGGTLLTPEYLREAYRLCRDAGVPVMVDEIQSCMWYPGFFLFRLYGLHPDMVAIGKGFPGGEYPASRIITTAEMDTLDQFGALVTNGQEELASLAYLVTMAFARETEEHITDVAGYYEGRLSDLAVRFPDTIDRIEGKGHLSSIYFRTVGGAVAFTERLNSECIDISAHTYKANCPPSALTKLPLVATRAMVDYLIGAMERALEVLPTVEMGIR